MYIPKYFEVTDEREALEFIRFNAFGQLISTVNSKIFSSHIPFYLDNEERSLLCHVAKNNPQWEEIEGQEVLVIFQGPHGYISPSWCDTPGVPTWNYQAIHIYGRAEIITEACKLKGIVNELTRVYESSSESPWVPEYKESMLNKIIGIEIKITELQCKYKLSQNLSEKDREGIVEQLRKKGSVQLSTAMKNEL